LIDVTEWLKSFNWIVMFSIAVISIWVAID